MRLKDFPEDLSDEEREEDFEEYGGRGRCVLYVIPSAILVAALLIGGVKFLRERNTKEEENPVFTEIIEAEPIEEISSEPLGEELAREELAGDGPENTREGAAEDPQGQVQSEEGAEADMSGVQTGIGENQNLSIGIDVARYQGVIDWQQVAASGVQFAMIRVGYRAQTGGEIREDSTAKYNMQEATKNGIKIGVYFFSTAVNDAEAVEEADWAADYISRYQITYPVAYNCEGFYSKDSRQFGLDKEARSNAALAFLNRISERGYTPMFYAAKNEMEGNRDWNTDIISGKYKIWVSQYPALPFPQTEKSAYSGTHAMWQYTNRGTIPGISKNVDMNVAYFGYDEAAAAQNSEAPEEVGADVEALMNFAEVNETVTAKDVVNLRDRPGQGADSVVLGTLANGEIAQRTGVSSSGWSRVEYNGQTLYCISSYLSTTP